MDSFSAYTAVKTIHVTAVIVTVTFFLVRLGWMLADSPRLQSRWVRTLPHVNDTLLLISAIALSVLAQQYPFVQSWITVKVLLLLLYIVFGTIALRRGRTKSIRLVAGGLALLTVGYIVSVAVTKNPWP